LAGLKGLAPAVRFSFNAFALLGPDGLLALSALLKEAAGYGFYVLLDSPDCLTPWTAAQTADVLLGEGRYPCDGVTVSPYIGTDAIRPFLPYCKDQGKDVFVLLRTPNKSAAELQDLLTGSRLVHQAAGDLAYRLGENILGKCSYTRLGAVVSATAASSTKNLRNAFPAMYMIVDGLDYPGGNHKNCAAAFDRFGHGAVACAGASVTAAWRENEDPANYVECAKQAAERMKKNLTRYVTVL
jgi:orotidine-5'-phosphate decarboxylase